MTAESRLASRDCDSQPGAAMALATCSSCPAPLPCLHSCHGSLETSYTPCDHLAPSPHQPPPVPEVHRPKVQIQPSLTFENSFTEDTEPQLGSS